MIHHSYWLLHDDSYFSSVDPNVLPTVLCTGVSEGTADDWNMVFNQYIARKSSQIREERYAYLFALTCTSDTALLDEWVGRCQYIKYNFYINIWNSPLDGAARDVCGAICWCCWCGAISRYRFETATLVTRISHNTCCLSLPVWLLHD